MSSLIVEVKAIDEVRVHPNADRLSLIVLGGWQCVVPRDRYKGGDLVAYIPPDTLLPGYVSDGLGVTSYLSKGRVRSVKLRGEPSFGLIVDAKPEWQLGENVASYFGATKYEPPLRAEAGHADAEHVGFPKFTDMENLRHFPDLFEQGEMVWVTEKIHGCLHEDTLILMADGTETAISSIRAGDMVIGYGDGGPAPTAVEAVIQRAPNRDVNWVELVFNNGRTLVCTENHLVRTANRGYVEAIRLNQTDDIIG